MKLSHKQVVDKLRKAYGNKYDLSSVVYINAKTDIEINCRKHGSFKGRLRTLISRKQDCPKCKLDFQLSSYLTLLKNKYPHIDFIDGQEYVNSKTKMKFKCSMHGGFLNTWNIVSKSKFGGCNKCANQEKKSRAKSIDKVQKEIKKKHNGLIRIINPEDYENSHSRLLFRCSKNHPSWESKVYSIIQGKGCPKCAGKNITTDEFRKNLFKIHKGSIQLVAGQDYKSRKSKLKFKCNKPDHPIFLASANNVIFRKSGCPKCKNEMLSEKFSFSTDEVYELIKQKHGNKIKPLPNQEYINQKTQWEFTCEVDEHPTWKTNIGSVLNGEYKYGCRLCMGEVPVASISDIRKELRNKFDNKITFISLDDNSRLTKKSRVKVYCEKHKRNHTEKLSNILKSHGCPECSEEILRQKLRTDKKILIKQIFEKHRELITLLNPEDYLNTDTKLKFKCSKEHHGVFESTPHAIIRGSGCPICKMSKGERKVLFWLRDHRIKFEYQFRVRKHIGKGHFIYDFYLPMLKTVIEYDGRQHYLPVERWGGKKNLDKIKAIDKLKDEFATLNNWKIIRIPYFDFNHLENYLTPLLKA